MKSSDAIAERLALWNTTLERLGAASDRLSDQVERAGEQFPELAGAFNLLLAYVSHLHEIIEKLPGVSPPLYALPEKFCTRNPLICKCAHGDQTACKLLGGELVPVDPEPPTCEDLWAQYLEALAKERSELLKALQAARTSGKPLQVADATQFQTLVTAQRASDRLRAALWAHKCALPSAAP
ncbi:MAG: hypothetical protein KatS3mg053_1406 [Candidatus Roseilinea sp.]|nr:MAG: hypothetical protein KatS3mg053_1406 [Candidatus Roseilinea sp.]